MNNIFVLFYQFQSLIETLYSDVIVMDFRKKTNTKLKINLISKRYESFGRNTLLIYMISSMNDVQDLTIAG